MQNCEKCGNSLKRHFIEPLWGCGNTDCPLYLLPNGRSEE